MRPRPGALFVLLAAILVAAPSLARGEGATPVAPDGARPALLFYPASPRPFDWRAGAGLLVDVLPARIVESEQRQIPQLTGALRVGLPHGFSADLRARAIVIQNQLELGVAWGYEGRYLSAAVHNHLGPWFGAVGVEGFDASAWGMVETPGASLGAAWRELRFSVLAEAIFTFAQRTTLGDTTTTTRDSASFAGTATTVTVETLLDRGGVPWFGVGVLWTRPDYQAWLAFSDERARILYPRFVAGYAF
jgi:hypothetical protein